LSPFPSPPRQLRVAFVAVAAAAAVVASGTAGQAATVRHAAPGFRRACAASHSTTMASCMALIRTGITQHPAIFFHDTAPTGDGYGPSSFQSAYKLPSSTGGAGQTVAVIEAFNDPKAASDLATYRAAWGEAPCNAATGAGCLTVVNQNGKASPLPSSLLSLLYGWATEESLDIDMVSAICPNCHILAVEASNQTAADLGTAVNSAISLGAKYVSNSWGVAESSSDAGYDTSYFNHPGVAVTASAGDSGYGVSYPAASSYVTSVGGTSLSTASSSRGWTESVWSTSSSEGTGSGCSAYEAKPSWQTDTGCAKRTDNDVAADADPATGAAIYDTFDQDGWLEVGGTSESSPIIASVFALAGTPAAGTYPSSYPYSHTSSLFDVTSGSDGSCSPAYLCTAQAGYDGPTGWGTPNGTAAFTP
jgi:subtilase family serine protease